MKAQTISISVAAARDDVFEYLSDIANIPHWAPRFCRRMHAVGTAWRVETPAGEFFFAVESDRRTGVIDLFFGEQLDEMMVVPLRVVSLPHGSAVIATYLQPFGMANGPYDEQYHTLLADMRSLVRRFGGGELHDAHEGRPSFHANLVTAKFYETWDFYSEVLGFSTVTECGFYVHLSHPSGAQLGLLRQELDGTPSELVTGTDGRGFWLSLDVTDADLEYARMLTLEVPVVEPPTDRSWGERSFLIRDPNGVLICISHRIPTPNLDPEPSLLNV